jgi:hypothetical protein
MEKRWIKKIKRKTERGVWKEKMKTTSKIWKSKTIFGIASLAKPAYAKITSGNTHNIALGNFIKSLFLLPYLHLWSSGGALTSRKGSGGRTIVGMGL